MTNEEKCKLIEAAKMIKEFCDDERCNEEECPFLRRYGCGINDTDAPKYWHIPEPKRWSREEVSFANYLKNRGAYTMQRYTSCERTSIFRNDGIMLADLYNNMFHLSEGELVYIDDIIKEAEEDI